MSSNLPAVPPPDFEPLVELARNGRHAEAVSQVERTLRADRSHGAIGAAAAALARVARLAEAAGNLDDAIAALDVAVRAAPTYADLHFQRAGLLLAAGRRHEGRQALEAALRINPQYFAARLDLALLDAREGRLGEALDTLRGLARDRNVREPRAYQQALHSLGQADWDQADARIKQAVRLADPVLDGALDRARALLHEGDAAQAAELLRGALARYPRYPDLHFLLGTLELHQGSLDDAVASFARALELNPDFHAARIRLARALESLGQLAQAADQVSLVLEYAPDEPQALEMQQRWSGRRGARRAQSAPRKGT